jgi:ADP-heptose:LPS heptosyltransferase
VAQILVIKLGALGDFVQATAALQSIRAHHKNDQITLLTSPAMKPFTKNLPWVDRIEIDPRRSVWNPFYLKKLRSQLQGFDRVYDLQTNDRTTLVYSKLAGKTQWNGLVKNDPLCHLNPDRNTMHSLDRLKDQLAVAGVDMKEGPDLSYMQESVSSFMQEYGLKSKKFICVIAGGSPHRPDKRWPHYVELIQKLEKEHQVVLVGAASEQDDLNLIAQQTQAINLCAKTSLGELVGLFKEAAFFVGNDTGPAHIAAASGLGGLVLFGSDSNPNLCAPKSKKVSFLRDVNDIASISPHDVYAKIKPFLKTLDSKDS